MTIGMILSVLDWRCREFIDIKSVAIADAFMIHVPHSHNHTYMYMDVWLSVETSQWNAMPLGELI